MGGAGDSVIAEFASAVEAVRRKIVLEIAGRVQGECERRDWALAGCGTAVLGFWLPVELTPSYL